MSEEYGIWGLVFSILLLLVRDLVKSKRMGGCEPSPLSGLYLKSIKTWFETKGCDMHEKITTGVSKLDELVRISNAQLQVQRGLHDMSRDAREERAKYLEKILEKL